MTITLGGMAALLAGHVAFAEQARDIAQIAGVRAMPYYPATGVIRRSTDLFDPRLVLRNIVIPEGLTGDPLRRKNIESWDILFGTTATFVDVEVRLANPHGGSGAARIELAARATNTGRQLMSGSVLLSALEIRGDQVLHVPFFVYGTGCEPLELDARLVDGSRVLGEVKSTIPFSCGE